MADVQSRAGESGQVIIFWMIAFVALLVPLAIIVEGGFIFTQRSDLQTTADAAALAGAQGLLRGNDQPTRSANATADATKWANLNFLATTGTAESDEPINVITFNVDPDATFHNRITVTVRKQAAGLFANGSFLSLGQPEVAATATARLGAFRLPGPGVFCIGVEATHSEEDPETGESISFSEAWEAQFGLTFENWLLANGNPSSPITPPPSNQLVFTIDPWDSLLGDTATLPGGPATNPLFDGSWYTVLRAGAGTGSNTGYVDISGNGVGSAEQKRCYQNGSENPLEETINSDDSADVIVDATPGIRVGPASQGFTIRGQAAYLNSWDKNQPELNCYEWEDVQKSIAKSKADPSIPWACSPLVAIGPTGIQETAVALMPIPATAFKFDGIKGTESMPVYDLGSDTPYLLAFYWIDFHRTFDIAGPTVDEPSAGPPLSGASWKFRTGGGQAQAEIWGVFLFDHPVNIGVPPTDGGGGIVDCNPDSVSTFLCFGQLVN